MLPSNVNTGRVHGRFIIGVQDGPDVDGDPDYIPAQGTVSFKASVPYLLDPSATPPTTIFTTYSIKGRIDSNGDLRTLNEDGSLAALGVRLIATDDPDLLVTDWTWEVSYDFDTINGVTPEIETHSLVVASGTNPDLTTAVKVPSSPGYGLPQAEAAATSAAADAAEAVAAALRAEAAANVTDAGVASLLSDPLSETGGALEDKLILKADAAGLAQALGTKADLVDGKVPVSQLPQTQLTEDPTDPGFYLIGG